MSAHDRDPRIRTPRPIRALLTTIRGPGADELIGDIIESHARRLTSGSSRWTALFRTLGDTVRSMVSWWSPGAVRTRRRRGGNRRSPRFVGGGARVVRSLVRRPRYAILVILTLGLGIGFTTTVFSVVDTVVLRSLPYPDAARLLAVGNTFPGREWVGPEGERQHVAGVSFLNFAELRNRVASLDRLAAAEHRSGLMTTEDGLTEFVDMGAVTEGFFELLGIVPALGRTFSADEYAGDTDGAVLISNEFWRIRFGADPEIVGTELPSLSSPAPVIVGVLPKTPLPPEAFGFDDIAIWSPIDGDHPRYAQRGSRSLSIVGRLAEGVPLGRARVELQQVAVEIAEEFPEGNVYPNGSHFGYGANTLHTQTVAGSSASLLSFLGGAGLLLLIAVLNSAGLQALRGIDRRDEIDLRRALGANEGRLSRELLTESLVLAAAGGTLGVILAYGGVELFLRWAPLSLPRVADVSVDWRVLCVAALVSLLTGLVSGAAPAWRLWRSGGAVGLATRSNSATSPKGVRFRMGLVSAQLGLALVLAVGASLLLHSFLEVRQIDPGFEPEGIALFSQSMKIPGTDDQPVGMLWDRLVEEVRTVPGVLSAAAGSNIPFESPNWAPWIQLPGDPPDLVREGIAGYAITPEFFDVLGASMVSGRPFDRRDGRDSPGVVIVNESFLREHAAEFDPETLTLRMTRGDDEAGVIRVVGVVQDIVQARVEDGSRPAVYIPHTQVDWLDAKILVRTDGDPESILADLRTAAARFSPVVPTRGIGTMADRVRLGRRDPKFQALLFGSFALFALVLSGIGLFGTLSHSVQSRARELGVRMAVGAGRGEILRLVLRRALLVTALGLALGAVGALFLTRTISAALFQVQPVDPSSFAVASAVLVGVAGLAVARPAHRATRVDVVEALRGD